VFGPKCLCKDLKKGYEKISLEQSKTIVDKFIQGKEKSDYIEYDFASGKTEGRLFSKTPSLQSLPRSFRHTVAKDLYIDIDLVNCHPVILAHLCERHRISIPAIQYYTQKREECLTSLCEFSFDDCKIDRDMAKTIILSLTNGGKGDLPKELDSKHLKWLDDYRKEIADVHRTLLCLPEYKEYLTKAQKARKPIPEGSAINNVFLKFENEILQSMIQTANSMNIRIGTLCFDGFMIYKEDVKNIDINSFLQRLSDNVYRDTKFRMKMVTKEMNEGFDLSGFTVKLVATGTKSKDSSAEEKEKTYQKTKKEFEQNIFKVLSRGSYYREDFRDSLSQTRVRETYCHDPGLPFLTKWFSDPEIRLYRNTDYFPPPLKCPEDVFNLWTGFDVEKVQETGNEGKLPYILDHLRFICGDENTYNYLVKWFANIFQFPGSKSRTAIVIRGSEGVGKGFIYDLMKVLLGKDKVFFTSKPEKEVFSQFNGERENKLLICINEISLTQWKKIEDEFKSSTTGDVMTINRKGLHEYVVADLARYMILTDKDIPVSITKNNRRLVLIEVKGEKKQEEYYNTLYEAMADPQTQFDFFHYLKSVDISGFVFERNIPTTSYYREIEEISRPLEVDYIIDLVERNLPKVEGEDEGKSSMMDGVFFTSSELLDEYIKFGKRQFPDFKGCSIKLLSMRINKAEIDGIEKKRSKDVRGFTFYFKRMEKSLKLKGYI
jgi:hypothetical protein